MTAQQIRDLTPRQADEARPVKLTGVVTNGGSPETGFHIQDATAGIFIRPTAFAENLAAGNRVEIVGVTHKGDFAPYVAAQSVKRLGAGQLPEPQPFNLTFSDSRWLDGQWVQAWVIVQNARSERGATFIDVYSAHGRAVLRVPGEEWTRPARAMRNEALAVRGVCVASVKDRVISDLPTILLSELPKPAPLPGEPPGGIDAPPRMINHLLEFAPQPYPGTRRVKIAGVVIAAPLHNLLLVQDDSGGAAVWTNESTGIAVGSKVEAYGLLRVEGRKLSLTHSSVTVFGDGGLPNPAPATAAELARGIRDAVRVRLAGRADELREVEGWTAISLIDDGVRFNAFVPGTPEQNGLARKVEIGSRVSLVGVPAGVTPDRMPPKAPGIFLQTEDSLAVLEPPDRPQLQAEATASWFASRQAAYMIGGLATVLFLGGGGMIALRRQARRAANEARRQSEQKVLLESQLREAEKLGAVGRLAGGIAHDFNNLLTVINGCAELLAEQAPEDGGQVSTLTADIRKAGERAASLTGQLLTYSRKRDIVIEAVNLNDVVADSLRLLDRVIGEDIRVESSLGDVPPVRGEAGLLHQVVMNLAVNARDAMPKGGVLSFTTSLVTDPAIGGVGVRASGRQFVRLTVADTGIGMTDDVKSRLFEPFFTTKSAGSGTGLGLSTVAGIVQDLRGRIRVDSSVGFGSRFHIDLRIHGEPISEPEFSLAALPTPVPPTRKQRQSGLAGTTVLVVEDSELVSATIAAGLKSEGATVMTADRPETALQLLTEHEGRVDALVTDVVLPGMSGPVLAERARERRPELRVVFMSGYTADEILRHGVRIDQVEFLQKPFTPDNLIRRLRRILAREDRTA